MKVREGFVSNSSSSSFIVAAKGHKPSAKDILPILGVPETSPLHKFAKEVAAVLASARKPSAEELVWMLEDNERLQSLVEQGFKIYEGSASDEGTEAAEYALCFMDINYKSDDLVIIKEGGY